VTAGLGRPGTRAPELRGMRRGSSGGWVAAGLAAAMLALGWALLYTNAAAWPSGPDTAGLVEWARPLARMASHLAFALVLGALVFGALILPGSRRAEALTAAGGKAAPEPEPEPPEMTVHPAFRRVVRIAIAGSGLWVLSAAVSLTLSCAEIGRCAASGDVGFTGALLAFVSATALGQGWLGVVAIAAAVLVLTCVVRSQAGLAAVALGAAAGVVPVSLMRHLEGSDHHNAATDSVALHMLGAGLWLGGTMVLALVARLLTVHGAGALPLDVQGQAAILRRFSALSGFAFLLVLVSGLVSSVIDLGSWQALATPYGSLVGIKAVATLVLGGIGLLHRRLAVTRLERGGRAPVWRLAAVEILILGAVSGVSVVLSRLPAPVPSVPDPTMSAARRLTGYELPPPIDVGQLFTVWRIDWIWLSFILLAAGSYLYGVSRLRLHGQTWPAHRTASWLGGLAVLFYVTCSAPAIYGPILFSINTAAHLTLALVVPFLLILGDPLHLVRAVAPPRSDGGLGLGEFAALASSARNRWLGHPVAAAGLLVGSVAAFYYSPAFLLMLDGDVAHELVQGYFIVVGACFYSSLLERSARPEFSTASRGVVAAVTAVLLGGWSGWLAASPTPIQAGWFTALGRDWGTSPLADQHDTALAVWFIAVLPTLILAAWVGLRERPGPSLRGGDRR
jgi:cytochrome c oxidase assembly factor CtaG/putative copper export protein